MNVPAARGVLFTVRFAAILLALPLATGLAQPSSTISLSNGIRLRITSDAGSGTPGPLAAEMKPATGNSIYRIFRDQTGLAVYAYELVVERLPSGDQFKIVAKPAGDEFAAKFPRADGGKPTPTLSAPVESPPLNPGGHFTIDIPTNPGWFEHRTDTVQVQPPLRHGGNGGPPLMRFNDLQVSIDGKPVPTHGPSATVIGPYVMFYIPKRGAYFFATQPVHSPPFVQIGGVDGTHLKFVVENDTYECTTATQILLESQRGQIWVYHDPHYRPAGTWTRKNPNPKAPEEFFTAASDSLNWWLP